MAGRALIVLYAVSTSIANHTAHPFEAALEQRLLALLDSRAKASRL